MMNRRSFLRVIPIALAGATLDPERLLWVPGAKTIFLPSLPVFTFNGIPWVTVDAMPRDSVLIVPRYGDVVAWMHGGTIEIDMPRCGVITNIG